MTADAGFSLAGLFSGAPQERSAARPNVLMVCTGNICRSALADAVLGTRLADLDILVHSAGTHAMVGSGMPHEAREIAERNGVARDRARAHRARMLTEQLMNDASLVLTMTAQHSIAAVELAPRTMRRTFTVREFARLAASVDDTTLTRATPPDGTSGARLDAVVRAVSDQRGTAPRADGDEDVIDPYRRPMQVYEQSASQLLPPLQQVERVIRLALG